MFDFVNVKLDTPDVEPVNKNGVRFYKVPDTDIVIIATNWTEYAGLTNMPEKIRDKTILDTRSLLSKDSLLNVKYITIN